MKSKEVQVTFQPSGRSVYVLPGTVLLEAAGRAGIILQTPCGGKGTCGKCRVQVVKGSSRDSGGTDHVLAPELYEQGYRLACRTFVDAALVVEVPEESRFESGHQILTDDSGHAAALDPAVRKQHFRLDAPSSEDPRSDVTRLADALGGIDVPWRLVPEVPLFLRGNNWCGTATISDRQIIALEPGDTTDTLYGVAFDLGTTTIVGTLCDLNSGREVAVAAGLNGQIAHGDDVIARIMKVRDEEGGLETLRVAVLETLAEIVGELSEKADIERTSIYEVTIAGNSTMQQICCGLDPSALGEVPFVQVFDEGQRIPASDLGLAINAGARAYVFPQVGGFVGGDTVAGMLAAHLDRWDEPVLLVDIGTNGEIVLAHDGRLMATSTAAGPAFEGARITQGMRAANGAIEKVLINDEVMINVIGDVPPTGLCGTALIDCVAGLLREGIIDETGRILPADEVPEGVSDAVRNRLDARDGETHFRLVNADESGSGESIYLWQRDVRELQLATGAIRAGISILMRRAGLEPEGIGAVLLAGAFGNFIRRSNARRIGLLPQVECGHIRFIGNAASLGAKRALLSVTEREYADGLRARVEHIDLSLDAEFQMEFGMAMMFPSHDVDACED